MLRVAVAAFAFLTAHATQAVAGLASSDVVVVVNAQSLQSRTLANYYIALRSIPSTNVVLLDEVPNSETASLDDFRTKILLPTLKAIEERKIGDHIQCIAYSADFPTAIDVTPHINKLGEVPKYITKVASINSLTFFYQFVLRDDPTYVDFLANRYAPRPIEALFSSPAGQLTKEKWKAILDKVVAGEHETAAELTSQLLTEYPNQFPLAYLAAAEYAAAGNGEQSLAMFDRAIQLGWTFADFTAGDRRLDAIRDQAQFQVSELALTPSRAGQTAARGFSSRVAFAPNGVPVRDPKLGFRYLLSVVLGVTRGQGSSLDDAIKCLARASTADYTHPQGSFYFASTGDVRSTTRAPSFNAAVEQLTELGFGAEIIKTALPQNAQNVLGAQLGAATLNWSTSGSKLAAGAIVDNLTSYGGMMASSSQTKLSRFLEAGAAGSSGTVTEPYSLQPKFPHPQMYVHYAQGASLAEAFYLGVTSPYQLLIVGDPLCKPFSHAPKLDLDSPTQLIKTEKSTTINLTFTPKHNSFSDWQRSETPLAQRSEHLPAKVISILSDGKNPKTGRVQPRVNLRMRSFSDGFHELTIRLASDDPLGQRSDWPIAISMAGTHQVTTSLALSPGPLPTIDTGDTSPAKLRVPGASQCYTINSPDQPLAIKIEMPGARQVGLSHESDEISTVNGPSASVEITPGDLGYGPIRLKPFGITESGARIQGVPILLYIPPQAAAG
ncbi:MAG TPA: hypothetical protein DDW52_12795 [Planctomycetaceae bacterium]|nr:hypothetical protein [Planctomycetaceae bacterium]